MLQIWGPSSSEQEPHLFIHLEEMAYFLEALERPVSMRSSGHSLTPAEPRKEWPLPCLGGSSSLS